jgi:hypothetical protein
MIGKNKRAIELRRQHDQQEDRPRLARLPTANDAIADSGSQQHHDDPGPLRTHRREPRPRKSEAAAHPGRDGMSQFVYPHAEHGPQEHVQKSGMHHGPGHDERHRQGEPGESAARGLPRALAFPRWLSAEPSSTLRSPHPRRRVSSRCRLWRPFFPAPTSPRTTHGLAAARAGAKGGSHERSVALASLQRNDHRDAETPLCALRPLCALSIDHVPGRLCSTLPADTHLKT